MGANVQLSTDSDDESEVFQTEETRECERDPETGTSQSNSESYPDQCTEQQLGNVDDTRDIFNAWTAAFDYIDTEEQLADIDEQPAKTQKSL